MCRGRLYPPDMMHGGGWEEGEGRVVVDADKTHVLNRCNVCRVVPFSLCHANQIVERNISGW